MAASSCCDDRSRKSSALILLAHPPLHGKNREGKEKLLLRKNNAQ
jgi:hypothetical protein